MLAKPMLCFLKSNFKFRYKFRLLLKLLFLFLLYSNEASGFDIQFVRGIISKPETLHRLYYTDRDITGYEKVVYKIDPINNERLGAYLNINNLLVGFAFDIIHDRVETSTVDIYGIYDFSNSFRLSLNYQNLKGLNSEARVVGSDSLVEDRFMPNLKSIRYEMNINYRFFDDPLFSIYVQNLAFKPFKSSFNISYNGISSIRSLELTDKNNVIFRPDFVSAIGSFKSIKALSMVNLFGPTIGLPIWPSFIFFLDAKAGVGYFYNQNQKNDLKESGFELNFMEGIGIAWSSQDQKMTLNSKFVFQQGRHIQTNQSEISFTYRFL